MAVDEGLSILFCADWSTRLLVSEWREEEKRLADSIACQPKADGSWTG